MWAAPAGSSPGAGFGVAILIQRKPAEVQAVYPLPGHTALHTMELGRSTQWDSLSCVLVRVCVPARPKLDFENGALWGMPCKRLHPRETLVEGTPIALAKVPGCAGLVRHGGRGSRLEENRPRVSHRKLSKITEYSTYIHYPPRLSSPASGPGAMLLEKVAQRAGSGVASCPQRKARRTHGCTQWWVPT
jgi:hypothetical protein